MLFPDWSSDNSLTVIALLIGGFGLALTYLQIRSGVKALQESAKANELAVSALQESAKANELSAQANQDTSDANDVAQLTALLALESSLSDARAKLIHTRNDLKDSDDPQEKARLEACREHYLNTLDRFCHCVRLGLFDEDLYRLDYRERVQTAVEVHGASFGPGTSFRHIAHVNKEWGEERSAADKRDLRVLALKKRRSGTALMD